MEPIEVGQIDLPDKLNDSFEEDYPAAHSMDTTWFAVDKDGSVAMFRSEETGAVPCAHARDQTSGREFLAHIAKSRGQVLPRDFSRHNMADLLGIYVYSCGMDNYPTGDNEELEEEEYREDVINPYELEAKPGTPLAVSDLPEFLQDEARHAMSYDGSFKDSPWLQPALQVPCQSWAEGFDEVTAIDVDGSLKKVPKSMRFRSAPPPKPRDPLPKIEEPPNDEFGDINFWRRHLK